MIQVLDRAMGILEFLGKTPGNTHPLSEIATALSLDKGTCTRILKTLASRGFVQQESPRGEYQIGYKMYHLIGKPVENSDLVKIARKDVEALGERLNETALLAVTHNDKRVVLLSTTPQRSLVVRTDIERNIYSVCAGRVILAHYTPPHLEKCINRLGLPSREEWPEIYRSDDPRKALVNHLTRIKQMGYDILDDGNGITGFAAPLFLGAHVVGSVGTYLPNSRLHDTGTILNALLECTREINRKLADS